MSASQKPTGSSPSGTDGRPRAQVAYEGDDEFSTMSLDPQRRAKPKVDIEASNPNLTPIKEKPEEKKEGKGLLGFFVKIFDK